MHLDRFCVLEGDALPLDSDGFLQEPTAWAQMKGLKSLFVPLAEACTNSAVLLGEAGIGKSHALTTMLDSQAPQQLASRWEARVRVDLGQVRSWEDLTRKARPVLDRLAASTGQPVVGATAATDALLPRFLLVLDGVDECQASGKEIAGWFTELADSYDCNMLQVLIGCRSMA